jgi:hypothetical protein
MRTSRFRQKGFYREKSAGLKKTFSSAMALLFTTIAMALYSQSSAFATSFAVSKELSKYDSLRTFDARYIAYRSGNDIGTALLKLDLAEQGTLSAESIDKAQQLYSLTYESKVKRFFLSDKRFEQTFFISDNDALLPIQYEYKRTGTGPNKALKLAFDERNNKIVVDNTNTLEWDGEFDNQLFRIDLPKRLASGIKQTEYDFINYRGEKRRYELEVVETENLAIPYGQLQAIKVKINRESNSRVTYAWFAPSLNYNLVRLQQFKDGKEQGDIQLSSFDYLGTE